MKQALFSSIALLVLCSSLPAEPIPGVGPAGEIKKVSSGHGFVEGPAWDGAGKLYFTDIPNTTIHVLEGGRVSDFTTDSRRTNGLMFTAKGDLVACEMSGAVVTHNVSTKERRVLADRFGGKPFNAPNDLVIDRTGGVYFTDPMFGAPRPLPQGQQGVYYAPADGGEVRSVAKDIKAPNGILLSPDEKTLYVLPSGSPVMLAYKVESPGELGPARDFCRTKGGLNEGSDGGAMDSRGNLYLTTSSGVQVFSPAGKRLGTIELPEHPANCTFGGADLKTLYVTARTGLYAVPMEVTGHRYAVPLDLPDPLTTEAGQPVTTPDQWRDVRRPELLELFRTHVYGRAPVGRPAGVSFEVLQHDEHAMNGLATLDRVAIHLPGRGGEAVVRLTLFVTNGAVGPSPGFLLICNRDPSNIDPTREAKSPFWPAEQMIERGYFAAAYHYGDVDPDEHDNFQNGVHGLLDNPDAPRPADAWGSIAAWAWGASRVMDYLQTRDDIDHHHVGVVGHSRGGKTALWCGAEDERFALVVSNNSGCTGAALARRKQGERVARINKSFPHWFCENYNRYNDREEELPVDQHELIALVAPRLAYVASASEDDWADPEGEFLSAVHAGPVYRLLGGEGVGAERMPPVERPMHTGRIGYHLRDGGHDLTEYDWARFMDFADRRWRSQ